MGRARAAVLPVAAALVVAGLGLAYLGVHDAPAARAARSAGADHVRAVALAHRPARRAPARRRVTQHPVVGASLPVAGQVAVVTIPALGVSAPVVPEQPVGGSLAIPSDVREVGWDAETPSPGQPGVTLLAGHVSWVGQGEGSLGQIGQLVVGDEVVLDWGGHRSIWTVSAAPRLSPNTDVHTALFTDSGPPRLALVTCGGPFTETAAGGSYADNVIVMATPS